MSSALLRVFAIACASWSIHAKVPQGHPVDLLLMQNSRDRQISSTHDSPRLLRQEERPVSSPSTSSIGHPGATTGNSATVALYSIEPSALVEASGDHTSTQTISNRVVGVVFISVAETFSKRFVKGNHSASDGVNAVKVALASAVQVPLDSIAVVLKCNFGCPLNAAVSWSRWSAVVPRFMSDQASLGQDLHQQFAASSLTKRLEAEFVIQGRNVTALEIVSRLRTTSAGSLQSSICGYYNRKMHESGESWASLIPDVSIKVEHKSIVEPLLEDKSGNNNSTPSRNQPVVTTSEPRKTGNREDVVVVRFTVENLNIKALNDTEKASMEEGIGAIYASTANVSTANVGVVMREHALAPSVSLSQDHAWELFERQLGGWFDDSSAPILHNCQSNDNCSFVGCEAGVCLGANCFNTKTNASGEIEYEFCPPKGCEDFPLPEPDDQTKAKCAQDPACLLPANCSDAFQSIGDGFCPQEFGQIFCRKTCGLCSSNVSIDTADLSGAPQNMALSCSTCKSCLFGRQCQSLNDDGTSFTKVSCVERGGSWCSQDRVGVASIATYSDVGVSTPTPVCPVECMKPSCVSGTGIGGVQLSGNVCLKWCSTSSGSNDRTCIDRQLSTEDVNCTLCHQAREMCGVCANKCSVNGSCIDVGTSTSCTDHRGTWCPGLVASITAKIYTSVMLANLNYDIFARNASLMSSLIDSIQKPVEKLAGEGSVVQVSVSPGSIVASIVITPSSATDVAALSSTWSSDSQNLTGALASELSANRDIALESSGPISVLMISAPTVVTEEPPSNPPTLTPSSPPSAAPSFAPSDAPTVIVENITVYDLPTPMPFFTTTKLPLGGGVEFAVDVDVFIVVPRHLLPIAVEGNLNGRRGELAVNSTTVVVRQFQEQGLDERYLGPVFLKTIVNAPCEQLGGKIRPKEDLKTWVAHTNLHTSKTVIDYDELVGPQDSLTDVQWENLSQTALRRELAALKNHVVQDTKPVVDLSAIGLRDSNFRVLVETARRAPISQNTGGMSASNLEGTRDHNGRSMIQSSRRSPVVVDVSATEGKTFSNKDHDLKRKISQTLSTIDKRSTMDMLIDVPAALLRTAVGRSGIAYAGLMVGVVLFGAGFFYTLRRASNQ